MVVEVEVDVAISTIEDVEEDEETDRADKV